MTKEDILIRRAERQDVPLLLDFIRGIARYEKMENEMIACGVCRRGWPGSGLRTLLLQFLDVHWALRALSGRPVCMAGRARQGLWQGSPAASCQNSTRASLRTHGMDVSQLEPA